MAKVVGSTWFTAMHGTVGVVLVDNGREVRAYIGPAQGEDMHFDEARIAELGAEFPVEVARSLIGSYPAREMSTDERSFYAELEGEMAAASAGGD